VPAAAAAAGRQTETSRVRSKAAAESCTRASIYHDAARPRPGRGSRYGRRTLPLSSWTAGSAPGIRERPRRRSEEVLGGVEAPTRLPACISSSETSRRRVDSSRRYRTGWAAPIFAGRTRDRPILQQLRTDTAPRRFGRRE